MFSEFLIVVDSAAWGGVHFSHLSALPVVADVGFLDAVQLCRTGLVRT
jgi:hypothetical protein